MTERQRGAQMGNSNALKHGFYSRKFKLGETADMDGLASSDKLQDEIMLLKVVIRRVWELTSEEATDLVSWAGTLNVLGLAMSRLARLLQVQAKISGENSEATQAISEAIRQVTDEFNGFK